MKKKVDAVVKEACETAAKNFGKPVDGFASWASESVVDHYGGRLIQQEKPPSTKSTCNKPVEAIREIWSKLSQPHVVATKPGHKVRRTILGAIASKHVSYPTACEFVKGKVSRGAFNEAKARRNTALQDDGISKL